MMADDIEAIDWMRAKRKFGSLFPHSKERYVSFDKMIIQDVPAADTDSTAITISFPSDKIFSKVERVEAIAKLAELNITAIDTHADQADAPIAFTLTARKALGHPIKILATALLAKQGPKKDDSLEPTFETAAEDMPKPPAQPKVKKVVKPRAHAAPLARKAQPAEADDTMQAKRNLARLVYEISKIMIRPEQIIFEEKQYEGNEASYLAVTLQGSEALTKEQRDDIEASITFGCKLPTTSAHVEETANGYSLAFDIRDNTEPLDAKNVLKKLAAAPIQAYEWSEATMAHTPRQNGLRMG